MVPRGFVIPHVDSTEWQLMKTEHVSAQASYVQQISVAADKAQRIDAFFAKRVDDHKIDVHSEGQKMMRIVMNPGCGWECFVNPQPTLDDLDTSIALARERNLRVLHLAGHAKKKCGFIWNRDDKATASREFDVDAIALAIGAVAQPHGPIECAVLNACSTQARGQKLRQRGVPCVLCWNARAGRDSAGAVRALFSRPGRGRVVRAGLQACLFRCDGCPAAAVTHGRSCAPAAGAGGDRWQPSSRAQQYHAESQPDRGRRNAGGG